MVLIILFCLWGEGRPNRFLFVLLNPPLLFASLTSCPIQTIISALKHPREDECPLLCVRLIYCQSGVGDLRIDWLKGSV